MNRKSMFSAIAALAFALVAGSAQANVIYSNQKITQIAAGGPYGGDVVIKLSGHDGLNRPACSTDSWSMRFDGTTEAGKQVLSMAVLAQSTGVSIDIAGENSCTDNAQTLRWIRLK